MSVFKVHVIFAILFSSMLLMGCNEKIDINETLALAAKSGDTEVFNDMLERGADINARDNEHNATALMWAAHEGKVGIVRELIALGAEIEATKGEGQTALWYAAQHNRLEAAKILTDAGANLEVTTTDGVSAMGIAQEREHQEMMKFLKEAGARK